jgi:hypothetical protein
MSQQMQKSLSEFMKTQMSKKSSKNTQEPAKTGPTEKEIQKEREKARLVEAKKESNSKIANAEKWGMYRRLIVEYLIQLGMLLAYCVVFGIAMVKFGSIIMVFVKNFLHGLFIPIPPKS